VSLSLYLIRHEDAEPGHDIPDAHRSLTGLGRRRMRATSALFASREQLDIILTSPMVRAVQTAELLAAGLGHDEPIKADRAIAEPQSVGDFLSVLDGLRADQRRVAIVGHEPTLSYVSSHLLGSRLPRSFSKGMILALDWDPKHVWITSFTETAGAFVLEGGAQSDPDVTQLAKRMQASVYFQEVTPRGGERLIDRDTGVTYYRFTITGKVVY